MWPQGTGRELLRPFWSFDSVLAEVFIVTVTFWWVPGLGLSFSIKLGEDREAMGEGAIRAGQSVVTDLKAKLRRWCLEM